MCSLGRVGRVNSSSRTFLGCCFGSGAAGPYIFTDPQGAAQPELRRVWRSAKEPNRATVVTIYLQEKNVIDPARLISVGYGQWRPVFSNDTPEGQAHNRRVELVISGLNLESEEGDSVSRYYTMRDGASQ